MADNSIKTDFQEIVRKAILKHTEVDVCFKYEQRRRYITDARDICCQILRNCNFLYREIAEYTNIDNARVCISIRKINDLLIYDKDFQSLYIKVVSSILQEIEKHTTLESEYKDKLDINELTQK